MKKKFRIKDRIKSFGYAFNGLKTLFADEHNARIHAVAAVLAITVGISQDITYGEWLWVGLAITLVFVTEMINTAVEAMCDEITSEVRPNIKKAKDVAAGAVLVSAFFSVVVAVFVFIL